MSFASQLLSWFQQAGRKHLPWQQQINPYRVWISEIMLQQTQVNTVIPYYERFMARFPDIQSLSAAPLTEVLSLWAGLGYYARARNLHKAAGIIVNEFGGRFPEQADQVKSLPGIGTSTAHAILAISFGQKLPILDGNVKRVLTRYHGIKEYPGIPRVEQALWQLAEALLPEQNIPAYTQAIMDLGALICTRSNPACLLCPVQRDCYALHHQCTGDIPEAKPKRAYPIKTQLCLFFLVPQIKDCLVLLEQRPQQGIWGGLFAPLFFDNKEALLTFAQHHKLDLEPAEVLKTRQHKFTHFALQFTPWLLKVQADKLLTLQLHAHSLQKIDTLAVPAPIKSLLLELKHAVIQEF